MPFPVLRHMPRRRNGHITAVAIGGERFRLTANGREDGSLGEVLLQWGKQGSAGAGLADVYAGALSAGLRHGVPPAVLLRTALGLQFVPAGGTDDPEIPMVCSVADYLARRLAIDWLPFTERAALGVFTIGELAGQAGHERDDPPGLCTARACRHAVSSAPPGSDGHLPRELTAPAGAAR